MPHRLSEGQKNSDKTYNRRIRAEHIFSAGRLIPYPTPGNKKKNGEKEAEIYRLGVAG